MSKKDEALKLALEWLEYIDQQDNDRDFLGPEECCALDDTRNTIREALAEQPAQQEPVAWRYKPKGDGGWGWSFVELKPIDAVNYTMEPLYTSPPARKPWVGLTDEEKSDLWCESTGRDCVNEDTHVFADAIEAKLKEKNT